MTKRRSLIMALVLAVASVIGYGFSITDHGCPGKITCPVTGQLICQNQCPNR